MPNVVNKLVVRELSEELNGVEGILFVSLSGLSVAEDDALRTELAGHGVRLRMVRNKLARVALRENGVEVPAQVFAGNVAMMWGSPEEAIQAAKIISKSPLKKDGKVGLRAGLLDGAVLSEADAQALADVPDRDTLRSMLLGTINAPARSLVTVMNAVPAGLARVIQAHVDEAAE